MYKDRAKKFFIASLVALLIPAGMLLSIFLGALNGRGGQMDWGYGIITGFVLYLSIPLAIAFLIIGIINWFRSNASGVSDLDAQKSDRKGAIVTVFVGGLLIIGFGVGRLYPGILPYGVSGSLLIFGIPILIEGLISLRK